MSTNTRSNVLTGEKRHVNVDVLDCITSLLDKSPFVSSDTATGDLRFRTLEVVRKFAIESLQASDEVKDVERRHAEYYLALGEEAEKNLTGPGAGDWINSLEMDHDNIRSAMGCLLDNEVRKAARARVSFTN